MPPLWIRLATVLAAIIGGLIGGIVVFLLYANFGSCPDNIQTCDLAPIAGVGLGLLSFPIIAAGIGWYIDKRLKGRYPRPSAGRTSGTSST